MFMSYGFRQLLLVLKPSSLSILDKYYYPALLVWETLVRVSYKLYVSTEL